MNPTHTEQFAVFVSSQEQYNALMRILEKIGYIWGNSKDNPTNKNYFGEYSKTAIKLQEGAEGKEIRYDSVRNAEEAGYKIITFAHFLKQYQIPTPKVNFLLKYDLDVDPVEEFETMKEVEARIDYLVQNARNLKKDSFVIYEVSKKHEVTVSTKITKKLVK